MRNVYCVGIGGWRDPVNINYIKQYKIYIKYRIMNSILFTKDEKYKNMVIPDNIIIYDKSLNGINKYIKQGTLLYFEKKYDIANFTNIIIEINRIETQQLYIELDNNGIEEKKIYDELLRINYKGLIIFNNIWEKPMRDNLWYQIPPQYKYSINNNQGIISFTNLNSSQCVGWTLVTAYFNLTRCPDASDSIKKRNNKYYLQNSISTLSLPYNMVIYCDKESFSQIIQIRPSFLSNKTKYIIREFDDFVLDNLSFKDYRNIIKENRIKNPYEFDDRNTPSYYLFCISRYIMLKETICINHFKSTHFAWINFCIERMGIENIKKIEEALNIYRNKFSTCYIAYIPKSLVMNTSEYFKMGRCSMCSGFFTGNSEYMFKVCDLIENKFLEYLKQGYGHADEQLYSPIFFENPNLFEHYYGDYQQMITNYGFYYDPNAIITTLNYFIIPSFNANDFKQCFKACEFILKSIFKEKLLLSQEIIEKICFYDVMAKHQMIIQDQGH